MFRILLGVTFALLLALSARADGIELRKGASALVGAPSQTSSPASVDVAKAARATAEYEQLKSATKGTARYSLLIAKMHRRIRAACEEAARAAHHDCVVREGDVAKTRGVSVTDLTDAVVELLEDDATAA